MLTDRDLELIRAALEASVDGPFFPDWEFQTLMGVERAQMRQVLAEWPDVSDHGIADLAVNNAIGMILGYPHNDWEAWRGFSDANPEDLQLTLARWQLAVGYEPAPLVPIPNRHRERPAR